jgi:hypothetical protein
VDVFALRPGSARNDGRCCRGGGSQHCQDCPFHFLPPQFVLDPCCLT